MLVARASKRTGQEAASDTLFDILADERALGRLSCSRTSLGATMTLDGAAYVVEHGAGQGPKPAADRYELKAADGRLLASAEQTGEVFQIARGAERFRFAKGRSKLLFDLWADGDPTPLGAVGQRKFWTLKMHMDLPDELGAPLQVFLLSLLLGLIARRAGSLTAGL